MTIEASTAGHRNRNDAPTRAKVVISASSSEMNAPAVRYSHLKKLFLPFFLMAGTGLDRYSYRAEPSRS